LNSTDRALRHSPFLALRNKLVLLVLLEELLRDLLIILEIEPSDLLDDSILDAEAYVSFARP
jgi:hypothetical protein